MADNRKFERLLSLYARFAEGAQLTVGEIIRDYQVNRRTVNRDLEDLRSCGISLDSVRLDNGEKRWSIPQRARKITVSYTLADLTALFMGRQLFDFLRGTLLEESLNKIYDSIEKKLVRESDLVRARELTKKVYLVSEGPKELAVEHVEALDDCLTALLQDKLLRVDYQNVKGEQHSYSLHPYTLVAFRRGLYLVARIDSTDDMRIFALERMKSTEALRGTHAIVPQDYDPDIYFRDCLFIHPGKPVPVKLLFPASAAPFILRRKFHRTQELRARRDGCLELCMCVPVNDDVVYFILSFGANVKVLERISGRS